jgi:hypothetical protein
MKNSGWKHKPKTKLVVGTETNPTKLESGQVVINKKATKQNLDRLIEINNDGLDRPIKKEVTTDGTEGGLLKGKAHYDKNGNSLGGIPAVVDGAKTIETEGEEFLLNKEASQKHWKELSKINQSAGNGVPINPSDVGADEDPQEFRKGGTAKIEFNPNHIPNKWIYSYAKKIKEKYPKVWDMGGNIFGNEAFKNLERVVQRGYWTDNEEWMYIKWQSYVARHHKDFRIAGTVAMLKWVDKTDKGWNYMKALIEKEIAKKYPKKGFKRKMSEGGGVEFIPEKKGTLIRGNEIIKYFEKVNGNYRLIFYTLNETKGKIPTICDAFGYCEELDIMNITPKELVELIKKNNLMEYGGGVVTYKNKYNKKYGYDKNESHDLKEIAKDTGVSLKGLQQIYNKGIGAYKTNPQSVRPNVKSKEQWAMARVYSAVMGGKAAKVDNNELKMEYGGGVKDIRCKCGWGWNKNQSEKHDEYVCHKCGTDNKMQIGGVMEGQPPANFENVLYTELANRYEKGGLIAPNGKKSNLTAEQYKLVRTPEFKAWFGDWENDAENASKVVDENGEPKVMWHFAKRLQYADERFNIFNVNKQLGSHFGSVNQVKQLKFYNSNKELTLPNVDNRYNDFRFYSVFLNIKYFIRSKDVGIFDEQELITMIDGIRPLKSFDWEYLNDKLAKKETKLDRIKHLAKSRDVDGIIYLNRYESTDDMSLVNRLDDASDSAFLKYVPTAEDSWIAFYPEQIKLADGTNTTFDGSSPDIRYKDGGTTDDFDKNKIELVSVNYLNNIRSQDKSKWDYDLEKSIEKYGITEPLTIGHWVEDGYVTLLDGHHRLDTAIDLGIEKVPTKIQIMHDNPIGKIKVYNIADLIENKMETGGNIENEQNKIKLEILKLTNKSFKMMAHSPVQKRVIAEISQLREKLDKLGGKFEKGGLTESHEDLERRIMKQQFGK